MSAPEMSKSSNHQKPSRVKAMASIASAGRTSRIKMVSAVSAASGKRRRRPTVTALPTFTANSTASSPSRTQKTSVSKSSTSKVPANWFVTASSVWPSTHISPMKKNATPSQKMNSSSG